MTRDHNIRRENTVDQNRLLGATPTRDLNSFKHFSGPKNKTLRSYTDFDNQVSIDGYKKLKNVQPTDGASCICVGSCLSKPQGIT